jgi:ribose/xylose/arabinose/galactoside ABC-type transport system permease subunit
MSTIDNASSRAGKVRLPQQFVPLIATAVLVVLLFLYGNSVQSYRSFEDAQVLFNVFISSGALLAVAVGMTFVILSGGIDLSVGSVVGMTAMICAKLLADGLPVWLVLTIALAVGPVMGLTMGAIIHYFGIQPFIVTLAGMFFARGMCTWISLDAIPIKDPWWNSVADGRIKFDTLFLKPHAIIALAVALIGALVLAYSRFGRTVYAIGGNEQSALLMGLPVARTKLLVYAVSGLCAAIGGIITTFNITSAEPLRGIGMELDAIAAVVIGGTVLTGGYGYVVGTVFGVVAVGFIGALITADGSLNSWWIKIITGVLLFAFILLQRLLGVRKR